MGVIDFLSGIAKHLPVIKPPERPPSVKERIMWTGGALLLFFIMYNVTCLGVKHSAAGIDFLQTITASNIGSLLTAGIGPVVLSSIFLQLFTGAGLINLNLKDKHDKQKFLEVQKIVAILLAVIEGGIFVLTGHTILIEGFLGLPIETLQAIVILQIAFGSIIILFLDEIISKYGVGSGIGLFIAAGVSFAIISGTFALVFGTGGVIESLASGGAEALPNAFLSMLPLFFMVAVFMIVVYFEGVKVEIPIAFERVRGMVPKLPLKYFYVSNIPVIFAAALLMNVQLFAGAILADADLPFIGYVTSDGQLADGLLYFITPIYHPGGTMGIWTYLTAQTTPVYNIPQWVHGITYVLFLSMASILFGLFWVETSNMDAKSVAGQLSDSGLQIPGFRRDPRMLATILNKYIFPLTVLGSFSVGLLAGLADLTGALGTGTGILLTVGILYRMYEQLEQMQAFEMYPALGNLIK